MRKIETNICKLEKLVELAEQAVNVLEQEGADDDDEDLHDARQQLQIAKRRRDRAEAEKNQLQN